MLNFNDRKEMFLDELNKLSNGYGIIIDSYIYKHGIFLSDKKSKNEIKYVLEDDDFMTFKYLKE